MKLYVGLEGEFEGIYIAHWEVSRFEMEITERKWWGVSRRKERCRLELPEGIESPWFKEWDGEAPPNWRHMGGLSFDVQFAGQVIEEGHFGHKGWCHWRIQVNKFLKVEKR